MVFKRNIIPSYFPTLEIKKEIESKNWLLGLLRASCVIELYTKSILKWILNNYEPMVNVGLLKVVDEMGFAKRIKYLYQMKKITKSQKKKIDKIRLVRNEIAHNVYFTHNRYIDEKKAKQVLEEAIEVINSLHKLSMSEQKKIKKK